MGSGRGRSKRTQAMGTASAHGVASPYRGRTLRDGNVVLKEASEQLSPEVGSSLVQEARVVAVDNGPQILLGESLELRLNSASVHEPFNLPADERRWLGIREEDEDVSAECFLHLATLQRALVEVEDGFSTDVASFFDIHGDPLYAVRMPPGADNMEDIIYLVYHQADSEWSHCLELAAIDGADEGEVFEALQAARKDEHVLTSLRVTDVRSLVRVLDTMLENEDGFKEELLRRDLANPLRHHGDLQPLAF